LRLDCAVAANPKVRWAFAAGESTCVSRQAGCGKQGQSGKRVATGYEGTII